MQFSRAEAAIICVGQPTPKPQFCLAIALPDVNMGRLAWTALVGIEEKTKAAASENDGHSLGLRAQDRADRQVDFGGFDLGAVAEAQARAFDKAALRVNANALGAGRDNLAEFFAAHRAKGRRHDLLRVEEVEL